MRAQPAREIARAPIALECLLGVGPFVAASADRHDERVRPRLTDERDVVADAVHPPDFDPNGTPSGTAAVSWRSDWRPSIAVIHDGPLRPGERAGDDAGHQRGQIAGGGAVAAAERLAAARSEYLRPNELDRRPASANAALAASRPTSSTTMFVASFGRHHDHPLDHVGQRHRRARRRHALVEVVGVDAEVGRPGASDRNVSALVSGVSSVTVPASSARATATRTASLTVDAA